MLRVRFTPTAVLEDVQPIRCAAFHPGGELIAIGSNSRALRVCSSHMLSDSVQTLLRKLVSRAREGLCGKWKMTFGTVALRAKNETRVSTKIRVLRVRKES